MDRKSVFVAHLARVHSKQQVQCVLDILMRDSRIARATHNIQAYRFVDPQTGALISDNDDDGEDAAGGRLAQLLQNMQVENVLVVVSRWFGGILLGPDRFRHINNAARLLIEEQAWYQAERGGGGGGGSKKGSKRSNTSAKKSGTKASSKR